MDAYISKPIEREILFETIDRLTGYSEGQARRSGRSHYDPVFDVGAVLDSLDGDSELLREIAAIFLAQCPETYGKNSRGSDKSRSKTPRTLGARPEGRSGKLAGAGSRGGSF